jgi:hypothetical protein
MSSTVANPAQAGTHQSLHLKRGAVLKHLVRLDPGLRRDDEV